jgi:hypothetical protein
VFANVAVAKTVIDKSQFIEFMVKVALILEPSSVAPLLPDGSSYAATDTNVLPSPEAALMRTTSALARVVSENGVTVSTSATALGSRTLDTPQTKLLAMTSLLKLNDPKFVR